MYEDYLCSYLKTEPIYKTYLCKCIKNPIVGLTYLPLKKNYQVKTNQLLFKVKKAQYQIKDFVDEVSH